MCKSCYSDPAWDEIHYRRQGAVDAEDFDEELRYRHPKRRKKKSRKRSDTRNACPVAEDGKHVYVWDGYIPMYASYYEDDKTFYEHFGYYMKEVKTCAGCLATTGSYRYSERYLKTKERKWRKLTGGEFNVQRGTPLQRYRRWGNSFYSFNWELADKEYVAKMEAAKKARLEKRAVHEKYWEYRRKLLAELGERFNS